MAAYPGGKDNYAADRHSGRQVLKAAPEVRDSAISAMANYAGNVAQPPLDAPFQPQAWDSGY